MISPKTDPPQLVGCEGWQSLALDMSVLKGCCLCKTRVVNVQLVPMVCGLCSHYQTTSKDMSECRDTGAAQPLKAIMVLGYGKGSVGADSAIAFRFEVGEKKKGSNDNG